MATDIEQLMARRATILADLASMTKVTVGGKPNAMGADGGTSVDHLRWRLSLYEELKHIDEAIKRADEIAQAVAGEDGAWEVVSTLYPG